MNFCIKHVQGPTSRKQEVLVSVVDPWTCLLQKIPVVTWDVLLYTSSGAKCTYDTLAFSWRLVIPHDKSGSFSLDCFKLVFLVLMVWIPDWTAELQFWPNQWLVGKFFDVWERTFGKFARGGHMSDTLMVNLGSADWPEKRVMTTAHPRTTFQCECPRGIYYSIYLKLITSYYAHIICIHIGLLRPHFCLLHKIFDVTILAKPFVFHKTLWNFVLAANLPRDVWS